MTDAETGNPDEPGGADPPELLPGFDEPSDDELSEEAKQRIAQETGDE